MTKIYYLNGGALLDPTNGVRMRIWLQLQMIYKCSRHDVLAASIVNDEFAYLVLDRTHSIKDLMSLCNVGELLISEQFLNTNYKISLFFGKVRITCLLNHDSIPVICDVDLLPLRAFIESMSTLSTPITPANVRLGI